MARAAALHRSGRSNSFIYRALWPDGAPVVESTFSTALADLIHDLDRLALMREVCATGDHGEYIERAIAGETPLPSDLAKSRDALLRTQEILLRRLEREGEAGEVRDLKDLSGSICNVAGKLLGFQRYRLDAAIIRSNISTEKPQPQTAPAHSGPAVVIDLPRSA